MATCGLPPRSPRSMMRGSACCRNSVFSSWKRSASAMKGTPQQLVKQKDHNLQGEESKEQRSIVVVVGGGLQIGSQPG